MRRACVILAGVVLLSPVLHAQDHSAGASYTLLSLTYPDQMPQGVGGWFTWDFIRAGATIGVDTGLNFFPEDHPIIGRQTQVIGGIRAGFSGNTFGAFARVRPGIVHFSRRFFAPDTVCVLIFPPPESCLVHSTNPAFDLGGTVEVYPTSRSVVRVDVGDTMIRFSRDRQDALWKHNFQLSAGAGFRF